MDLADVLLAIAGVTVAVGVIGAAKQIPGAAIYAWRVIGKMVRGG